MKKIALQLFYVVAFTLFAFVAVSFIAKKGKPTKVAEKFVVALQKHDYASAKKYSTQATKDVLTLLEALDTEKKAEPAKKLTFLSEKIEGDKATVTYKVEGNEEIATLKLEKEGKEWLVGMNKEDFIPENDKNK